MKFNMLHISEMCIQGTYCFPFPTILPMPNLKGFIISAKAPPLSERIIPILAIQTLLDNASFLNFLAEFSHSKQISLKKSSPFF